MNTKGFTMIELIAIITVLSAILLVSFPTIINMTRKDKEKQYNDMVTTLCKAGETYIYDHEDLFPVLGNEGSVFYVDIDELKENDLINKSATNSKTENNLFGNIKYIVQKDKSLKCYYDENMPISNMIMESIDRDTRVDVKFLNTPIESKKISKLLLHSTIDVSEGYEQEDCSYLQDESVICYWKEDFEENNKKYYEMNISANGQIYTPYDSEDLFLQLGYEKLTELDLSLINTKYTNNMSGMLSLVGYNSMESLNLGNNFDTSNVTNMHGMFWSTGYGSMTSLDLKDKFDTSNVTDMSNMFIFTGLNAMTSLDLGDKFDTSNVTNMNEMFNFTGQMSMTSLDLGDKFDTSNVTEMGLMFSFTGEQAMTSLNLGDKFDTSNVTVMTSMFWGTGRVSMTSLDLGDKFVLANYREWIFKDCGGPGILTQVIVPNQTVKDTILEMDSSDVPNFWKDNNGAIIQVRS